MADENPSTEIILIKILNPRNNSQPKYPFPFRKTHSNEQAPAAKHDPWPKSHSCDLNASGWNKYDPQTKTKIIWHWKSNNWRYGYNKLAKI